MRKKSERMEQLVLDAMRRIYASDEIGDAELDWMGYELDDRENDAVYHHIVSEKDGGSNDIENGAILGRRSRHMLHILATKDPELFDSWNEVFTIINQMGTYPISEVWNMIMSLQAQTEQVLNEDAKVLRRIK